MSTCAIGLPAGASAAHSTGNAAGSWRNAAHAPSLLYPCITICRSPVPARSERPMTTRKPDRATLDPIEIASRDELSALQLERLRWSVGHAYENVPHYRRTWDA